MYPFREVTTQSPAERFKDSGKLVFGRRIEGAFRDEEGTDKQEQTHPESEFAKAGRHR